MVRIRKTYKPPQNPGGLYHREHRIKKNKRNRIGIRNIKEFNKKKEQLIIEECESEMSEV